MNIEKGLVALEAEDFSKVIRITRKKLESYGRPIGLSDVEAEKALRQYYALPLLEHPRQQFAISSTVDNYWHFHVLDTKEYRQFCQRVYGCFMDHVPLDPDDEVDFQRVRQLYFETREILVKHFGGQVSEKAYPIIKDDGRDVVICSYDYCITENLFERAA